MQGPQHVKKAFIFVPSGFEAPGDGSKSPRTNAYDNIIYIFGPCIRAAIESNPIDRCPEISRLQLAAGGALLLLAPELRTRVFVGFMGLFS